MSSTETNDEYWMQFAYEQANLAASQDEIPVGAVIVSQNKVIGSGYNAPIKLSDPTAHAEIQALYVTLEPCTMCVGALIHARIKKVVFATTEPKAGSLVSARQLLESGYYNHKFTFEQGCMQAQCSSQLSEFFKRRRDEKRKIHSSKTPLNDS